MIRDLVIAMFVAAARRACRWPNPARFTAAEALCSLPLEAFDGELWTMELN